MECSAYEPAPQTGSVSGRKNVRPYHTSGPSRRVSLTEAGTPPQPVLSKSVWTGKPVAVCDAVCEGDSEGVCVKDGLCDGDCDGDWDCEGVCERDCVVLGEDEGLGVPVAEAVCDGVPVGVGVDDCVTEGVSVELGVGEQIVLAAVSLMPR